MQDKNLQKDEALDSLSIVLGEIAHDFNNILSLIFGYVEMALSEIPEGQRARSDLEHVLAAGDRAKELVARILTYSNQNKLKHSDIVVEKPVVDAIAAYKDKLPKNITIESSIDSENGIVFGNYSELFQVVTNLLSNSAQAIGKQKGLITVTLGVEPKPGSTESGHVAVLAVEDNGCGMDLETLSKIYTPFYSSSRNADNDRIRAGLGMTTVYNIVSNMNGEISVESTPDKGTIVEIRLPLVALEFAGGEKPEKKKRTQGSKHILFIDDEEAITTMAEKMLRKNGYEITTFNDANQAIEQFMENRHKYDAVITDLVMPNISGTEVAQKISRINPHVPIILTTGFSEKITTSSCSKWGISLVMNKPFAMNDLMSALASIT